MGARLSVSAAEPGADAVDRNEGDSTGSASADIDRVVEALGLDLGGDGIGDGDAMAAARSKRPHDHAGRSEHDRDVSFSVGKSTALGDRGRGGSAAHRVDADTRTALNNDLPTCERVGLTAGHAANEP